MRDCSPHASPQIDSPNCIGVSVYETTAVNTMGIIQIEKSPIFAFRWNGIDSFSMIKTLLCCVQVGRKERDKIAWNQIAEGKDEAINSKEGEGKAEYVDEIHPQKQNNNGQVGTLD